MDPNSRRIGIDKPRFLGPKDGMGMDRNSAAPDGFYEFLPSLHRFGYLDEKGRREGFVIRVQIRGDAWLVRHLI